ncbi:hypothetical protein HKCCE2091_10960 [Rhodobacterales bacterium HKCCE2091]|nr:hypothetical protein [Rhodobacterales bacterium HKCCE2091]
MTRLLPLILVLALAGCGGNGLPFFRNLGDRGGPAPASDPAPDVLAEETEEEAGPPAASGPLGTTVATLGDATVTGLWMETPLVDGRTEGRVTAENGTSVTLTLIPSGGLEGSGSRLSLQAMQALGLPLTAIAEVSVAAL